MVKIENNVIEMKGAYGGVVSEICKLIVVITTQTNDRIVNHKQDDLRLGLEVMRRTLNYAIDNKVTDANKLQKYSIAQTTELLLAEKKYAYIVEMVKDKIAEVLSDVVDIVDVNEDNGLEC